MPPPAPFLYPAASCRAGVEAEEEKAFGFVAHPHSLESVRLDGMKSLGGKGNVNRELHTGTEHSGAQPPASTQGSSPTGSRPACHRVCTADLWGVMGGDRVSAPKQIATAWQI